MRTFVILGIILILVSIVGAKFALDHQTPTVTARNSAESDASKPPDKVVCWGFFEADPGVVPQNATQLGDIVEVKPENTPMKAGDVLLQVNDRLAQLKLEQAKEAVKAAEQQLAEARQLPEFYKLQKDQQKSMIKSFQLEIDELKLKRDRDLSTLDEAQPAYKTAKQFYATGLDKLAERVKAENAKLQQLDLQDAKLKIAIAEADRDAKKAQVKEAEEMLKNFQIRAPHNGIILRANVKKGEVLGPNPMKHAIEFLPDGEFVVRAEVLQEWGRFIIDPKEHPGKKQDVEIEDDTYKGPTWKGTVKSVSKWYAPARSQVLEPFRYNDVRTLEVIIAVKDAAGARINQRVRAKVSIN